jgi:hypothetical protein
MRDGVRILFGAIAAVAGVSPSGVAWSGVKAREPPGLVRFLNIANSSFDVYTLSPDVAGQAWMRAHYFRMQTYSPYFDSRLQWFPNAWFYKDAYAIKSAWAIFTAHPEWVLRDANGDMLYIPWGCSNGACPQYAGDFGNPEFRANWIREAELSLDEGYFGLFIDDVNMTWRVGDGYGNHVTPIDPRTGTSMTLTNWRRYFAEFLEEVRAAFPNIEIAHNAIWYAGSPSDPHIRRQIAASDYFNFERGATDSGLTDGTGTFGFETFLAFIDAVHAQGRGVVLMDYGTTTRQREYALAAWLLISDGVDLLSSDQLNWTAPDRWWPGYGLDLGAALGRRYWFEGLLRRDFDCGTVLLNPPRMAPRSVALASAHRTIDGALVTGVALDASSAAVFLRDCDNVGPSGETH